MNVHTDRRTFVKSGLLAATPLSDQQLAINPKPLYDLSPHLYMQFMEPLGVTDSSVEAAWNHKQHDWRNDVVEITRQLSPSLIRWGGIFSDYYRWREGVGPRQRRVPMRNLLWGGYESNQVGTAEFVDFARRVGAEPLLAVNFESDGRAWYTVADGSVRTADAREAAAWVAYCNQPDHLERRAHGHADAFNVPYWQLGNETSYARKGFDLDTAIRKTIEFATAMKRADSSIQLIGWGDSGWARPMTEAAGEHLRYVAFHHMFNPDDRDHPVLGYGKFRQDPARTWEQLMNGWRRHDEKIRRIREEVDGTGMMLALTECHYTPQGRNRGEVLSTWAAGVSYARILNVHERHGDVLKIATAADFCGTRWQVNAVMIPVPGGKSFLMPVAHMMKLYRRHSGEQAVAVERAPSDLDVTASRTGNRIFLHVVNTNRTASVATRLSVAGKPITSAKVFEVAADPMLELRADNRDALTPREKKLDASAKWRFPPASVSAVELTLPEEEARARVRTEARFSYKQRRPSPVPKIQ